MRLRVFGLIAMALLLMGQVTSDPQALYEAGMNARVGGHSDDAIRLLSAAIATGKLNDDDLATSYNNRGMAHAATARRGPDDSIRPF